MTIRFAAARGGVCSALAQALCSQAPLGAANDNVRVAHPLPANDTDLDSVLGEGHLLNAALRHFAQHGLAAAAQARSKAEAARLSGDESGFEWWLGVCRQLDRRMADALERKALPLG